MLLANYHYDDAVKSEISYFLNTKFEANILFNSEMFYDNRVRSDDLWKGIFHLK